MPKTKYHFSMGKVKQRRNSHDTNRSLVRSLPLRLRLILLNPANQLSPESIATLGALILEAVDLNSENPD